MAQHRILIVDDEPKVTFFFQQHLEMIGEGYTVTAVNSGKDALAQLKKQQYDLMITDLRMPEMDGLELIRHTRKISPNTRIMLVTAYGTSDVFEEAERLDIFRSLSKPLKIADLLASVNEALKAPKSKTSGVLAISGDTYEILANRLETLRIDLGARASVLADTTGRILAYTGSVEGIELSSTMALLGSTMAAASELVHKLKYETPIHLSYFEGPPYDLYASNVGENFFLTTLHDRGKEGSRIGLVWLYTRRALDQLLDLLGQKTNESTSLGSEFAESVQAELDDFFDMPEPTGNLMSTVKAPVKTKTAVTRPKTKQPPANQPLGQKLAAVLDQFGQQTGMTIESYLAALDDSIPTNMEGLILRSIGEILKNTYLHGQASIIGVSFSRSETSLNGRVADNGIGFDMSQPPQMKSLDKLRQKFQMMGGQFNISAYQNYGTTVNFQLPLDTR